MAPISPHAKENGRLPALLNYPAGAAEVSITKPCLFISFIACHPKRGEERAVKYHKIREEQNEKAKDTSVISTSEELA